MDNYKKIKIQFVASIVTLIFGVIFVVMIFVRNKLQHEYGNWYALLALYFACLALSMAFIVNKEWVFYTSFVCFGLALYFMLATRLGGGYYWVNMLPIVFAAPCLGLLSTTLLGYFKIGIFAEGKYYRSIHLPIVLVFFVVAAFGIFTNIIGSTYKAWVFFGGSFLTLGLSFMIHTIRKNVKRIRDGSIIDDIDTLKDLNAKKTENNAKKEQNTQSTKDGE